MQLRYFVALVFGTAFLGMVFSPPTPARAAEGINLQISPLPIELVAEPGHSVSADLRVRNVGNGTEKLQVRLLKVTADDNGQVHLLDPSSTDEFVSWVKFSQTTFDAPSNEWQTIKMTVDVPKSAAFGYYFAAEFLRANLEKPTGSQAVARGAVATFVLLNAKVAGAKREAQVTSLTADHQFYEFLPATFKVKVHASGNVHVVPHGNIFIYQNGKVVGTIDVNPGEGSILPNSSRFFETKWQDSFPHYEDKVENGQPVLDKAGHPVRRLIWDFSKLTHLRIGHFTAKLVMVYNNGQRDVPIEGNVGFWVIPWRVLLGLFVLGLLVVLGLSSTIRGLNARLRRLKMKL